ncbi:MAG TPA: hypothetical protein VJ276_25100 [Thermoanaerobaculia bacterium]|nr:hypothetical protein [Thermoanaerobaculia bacterium]
MSRIRPVATGGITSGSISSVSTSDFPGQRWRASSQATPRPNGAMRIVLSAATCSVNAMMRHSAAVISRT